MPSVALALRCVALRWEESDRDGFSVCFSLGKRVVGPAGTVFWYSSVLYIPFVVASPLNSFPLLVFLSRDSLRHKRCFHHVACWNSGLTAQPLSVRIAGGTLSADGLF